MVPHLGSVLNQGRHGERKEQEEQKKLKTKKDNVPFASTQGSTHSIHRYKILAETRFQFLQRERFLGLKHMIKYDFKRILPTSSY